jgi:hypothetical protein
MKYLVEFELQADFDTNTKDAISKALVTAFGSVDRVRVTPQAIYIGVVKENQPVVWKEASGR